MGSMGGAPNLRRSLIKLLKIFWKIHKTLLILRYKFFAQLFNFLIFLYLSGVVRRSSPATRYFNACNASFYGKLLNIFSMLGPWQPLKGVSLNRSGKTLKTSRILSTLLRLRRKSWFLVKFTFVKFCIKFCKGSLFIYSTIIYSTIPQINSLF